MTKNWKTTAAGVMVAILAAATYFGWLTEEQGTSIMGLLTALGLFAAKDNNVTGGDVKQ